MSLPRVTVLMPVYNAEAYLREAIDSILGQTFTDFEFLTIDDGSSDSSAAIIRTYTDPRIRFVQNEHNLKLPSTLNKGLDLARGEYVARMDSDDISLPERLARQVAFMDAHPDIGLCGTGARAFGAATFQMPQPAAPEAARAKLLFDSPLVHPSVLLRRALFNTHGLRYPLLPHFEDYVLWQQAARVFPLANLPDYLLRYRVTAQSAFHAIGADARRDAYRRIDAASLPQLGITPTDAELDIHNFLRRPVGSRTDEAERWLLRLASANRQTQYYAADAFRDTLRERWFLVCYLQFGAGYSRWRRYARSPLSDPAGQPRGARLKLPAKFLLQSLRARLGH